MASRGRKAMQALALLVAFMLIGALPGSAMAASPTAFDDAYTLAEDAGPTAIDVLDNDEDPDGHAFVVTAVTQGTKGVVAIDPLGAGVTYTPTADANGTDSFTYTITDGDTATVAVTIGPVNDPPVAIDDPTPFGVSNQTCGGNVHTGYAFMVPEDWGETVLFDPCTPIGNDLDADGDPLSWEVVTGPQHGSIERITDEGFEHWLVYTADPDFGTLPGNLPGAAYTSETGTFASDTFTYRAFDGTDYSEPATFTYWIVELNDEPTFTPGGAVSVGEDSGPYSAAWATEVLPGPALEAWQTVSFEVTGVAITGPGDLFSTAPAVRSDGTLTFTPRANRFGSASVTVRAKDDGGTERYGMNFLTSVPELLPDDTSEAVTFTISVGSANDAPTADDDSVTVLEDAAATSIPVLTGDADVDGDGLTITAATQGSKGSVAITGGGTGLTYAPDANRAGSDSFTYTISDGNGGTDTGTVAVTITAVNDGPPLAVDDLATIPSGPAVPVAVLVNDTDVDDDPLLVTGTSNGVHGRVAITGAGTGLTYDPDPLFAGTDVFTYTVSDGVATDTATVTVTVTADQTPPTISKVTHSIPAQGLSGSRVRVKLQWAASDTVSGIANYHLQLSVNGGAFATVALASPTSTSYERVLASNTTYRFRVRAKDQAGNVSPFSSFPSLNPVVLQEGTSLATYTGTWSTSTNASMSGGTGRYSAWASRRVAFTFTGKGVGWVTTRTTSSGRAAVYLDGVLKATIALDTPSTIYRSMIYRATFATAGRHTLEIRPLGDGRVDMDAFVLLR